MATTSPVYGWPLPDLTDPPNAPQQVSDLADAIETTVSGLSVAVVSSLPASASDGEEVDLLVPYPFSNTIIWRFRYYAGESTAFKWFFVGGPPLFNKRDPAGSVAPSGGNDWQTLSGTDQAGPAVTLPVDAYYDIKFGASINSAGSGQIAMCGVSPAGSDPGNDDTAASSVNQVVAVTGSWFPFDTDYPASTSMRLMYRCSGSGGTATYQRRWISVLPVKAKP